MTELWPSRSETAGNSIPAANKCEPWECLKRCSAAPFGLAILSRWKRSDTDDEIEFGFKSVPSGFGEYQVKIGSVYRPKLLSKNLLCFSMRSECRDCRTREHK